MRGRGRSETEGWNAVRIPLSLMRGNELVWVPRATIKIIKIITTVKTYRRSEISLGRQEVTGLFGGFLAKMGPGALQRVIRNHRAGDRRPVCVTSGKLLSVCT